jgi:hypothetical protein
MAGRASSGKTLMVRDLSIGRGNMATAVHTTNHDEIRRWVEEKSGRPAKVKGTGVLRIDFGEPDENLESIGWDEFFKLFDQSKVEFIYDPEGHFNKFVREEHAKK